MAAKKAIILGGGIGGMTAATTLRRADFDVRLIEQSPEGFRQGHGICLTNNAIRALDEVDLAEPCIGKGFGFDKITTCDSHGNVLREDLAPRVFRPDRPATLGMRRTDLADILEDSARGAGAQFSFEQSIRTIEQTGQSVRVTLGSGETLEADLLVAADGAYSKTRSTVFSSDLKTRFAGQSGWRVSMPRPETLEGLTFFRHKEMPSVGAIPLSRDWAYIFFLENSAAPVRKDPTQLDALMIDALRHFDAPTIQHAIQHIRSPDQVSFRPFDALLVPQPWFRGRVVLLGDAAHSLTPQLTNGGGMAIEDAVVLGEELFRGGTVDEALQAYSARRFPRVRQVFENSYQICQWEQEPHGDGAKSTQLLTESYRFLTQPH
jgi:2-polyprenyl-6-methoxyphenol hydroxylase-like FAD-dependent oxidoreductase